MSGDATRSVELFGAATWELVQAMPDIEAMLGRSITLVGGLAVLSRLGSAAHRAGDIRVDTLEISADQLNDLPPDPTDRLYLLAHDWALRTATNLRIRAADDIGRISEATVLVAEPGPLITTKLQALPNRTSQKRGDRRSRYRSTHTRPVHRSYSARATPPRGWADSR